MMHKAKWHTPLQKCVLHAMLLWNSRQNWLWHPPCSALRAVYILLCAHHMVYGLHTRQAGRRTGSERPPLFYLCHSELGSAAGATLAEVTLILVLNKHSCPPAPPYVCDPLQESSVGGPYSPRTLRLIGSLITLPCRRRNICTGHQDTTVLCPRCASAQKRDRDGERERERDGETEKVKEEKSNYHSEYEYAALFWASMVKIMHFLMWFKCRVKNISEGD